MAGHAENMITLTSAEHDAEDSNRSGVAETDPDGLAIVENDELGIYEAVTGGRSVAGIVYHKTGNRVTLMATSVLPEFRGKGVAAKLLGGVLDDLRRQGKTATVTCPFAAAFVEAHPEYADVLDPEFPGTRTTGGR